MSNALLLKFRETDTPFGVRREVLKAIAEKLGVSETQAAHIAIGRLYSRLFDPEDFDFPSDEVLAKLDRSQEDFGKVVRTRSLSDHISDASSKRRVRR